MVQPSSQTPNLQAAYEAVTKTLIETYFDRLSPDVQAQIEDKIETLASFLKGEQTLPSLELPLEDRLCIVEQAITLLEMTYVHLPLKRSMYAVDPVRRLKLLRFRLEQAGKDGLLPVIQFHTEMLEIFNSLRDLHTSYHLPPPFDRKRAVLPFLIEECYPERDEAGASTRKEPVYIVSKIFPGFETPTFQPGAEVCYWNGIPIRRAIELNAQHLAGSNAAANFNQGLAFLTIRPLFQALCPDEEWVVLGYLDRDGKYCEIRQDWMIVTLKSRTGETRERQDSSRETFQSLDEQALAANEVNKLLFAPGFVAGGEGTSAPKGASAVAPSGWIKTSSNLPNLRARTVETQSGTFGYLRIFSFDADPDLMVSEVLDLITEHLPPDGLIIDIRSNPGGDIRAAEQLLQLFTPERIEPEPVQFIVSPLISELSSQHTDLNAWSKSIQQAALTGEPYSLAHPISDRDKCNEYGQQYFGPVVLITDAKVYSAADIFAAGFQDHEIGKILGVHENTGAGGANVWKHSKLCQMLSTSGTGSPENSAGSAARNSIKARPGFAPLPKGVEMRVAIRRNLRVKGHATAILESLGVEPNCLYPMTRDDLLFGNRDLIEKAGEMLGKDKEHRSRLAICPKRVGRKQRTYQLRVCSQNIDRVDLYLDGRCQGSFDIRSELEKLRLNIPRGSSVLTVRGFERGQLRLARQVALDLENLPIWYRKNAQPESCPPE